MSDTSELNIEDPPALVAYLRELQLLEKQDQPRVHVLTGGVSNRTVHVEMSSVGPLVVKQALSKLRVVEDWYCDPARIRREAMGLRWLENLLPAGCVPGFVFEDQTQLIFGMHAVATPHENWKALLLQGEVDETLVAQFGQILAWIHEKSAKLANSLEPLFSDQIYFRELRLEPYYGHAARKVAAAAGFLDNLQGRTAAHTVSLVHGDYSPKNVLVHKGRLVLLDHEVIHWGDPAFDVGFALTHLLSKAHHLFEHRAAFRAAARHFWHSYRGVIGTGSWQDELEPNVIDHTLACLLARVAGKSPLEYLRPRERERQQTVVCQLVDRMPSTVDDLIASFIGGLP